MLKLRLLFAGVRRPGLICTLYPVLGVSFAAGLSGLTVVLLVLGFPVEVYAIPVSLTPVAVLLAAAGPRIHAHIAAAGRGSRLDPRVLTFSATLQALLASGMRVIDALQVAAKEFPEFSVEVEYVALLSEGRGEPLWRVLQRVAELTPSRKAAVVFMALGRAARLGANPVEILSASMDQLLRQHSSEVEKSVTSIGLIVNLYTAGSLLVPLLAAVMSLLAGMVEFPLSPDQLLVVIGFVVVPAIVAASFIVIDAITSRVRV